MDALHLWRPQFPAGRIERLYLHWSGGDYASVFPAYHFCVALIAGETKVAQTHDLRANMRDVSSGGAYAAHTQGRNSYAAGIAAMGMLGAQPDDFGRYPIGEELIDALCQVGAKIVCAYGIAVDAEHVMTHAEAAISDGYFGAAQDERWDIARFVPSEAPLTHLDARAAGESLRARIRAFAR